jgi:flagellar biosynthetic protein FliR
MSLHIDIGWLLGALLVSVRIAAATAFAPVFGPTNIPAPVKVLVALALGALLVSILPGHSVTNLNSLPELAIAVAREALIGLSFGFGLLAAYAATQVAGRALDVQIGFGAASVLNPAMQGLSPLIGSVLGMAFVAVFLALDGHHLLLQGLAASLVSLPPNADSTPHVGLLVEQSGIMFAFGLSLAAPVMFALWLSDVAMAVFARSMPQLNVFVLSFAIKIVLGTIGLALSIGVTRKLFHGLLESTFRFWDRLPAAG